MFNEKDTEQGLPVWQSPKYEESKAKALEMINDGKYGLKDGDFWILMNKNKNKTKMIYTGLIISHNGCLKINDVIENKVDPKCFVLDKEGYNKSLVYTYVDKDVYEVGEVSVENCQNNYPYAMAFKRCFDRVVLKKSKLAFSGIYSEVEAEEFRERPQEEVKKEEPKQEQKLSPEEEKKNACIEFRTYFEGRNMDANSIWKLHKLSLANSSSKDIRKVIDAYKEKENSNGNSK